MISVCIATFNGEKFILNQIQSILQQLSENDEIIISDDCSTDSTINILKSFCDKRINIISNAKKFKNHNFNFENALKYAKGDFIFLADQDDIWFENKITKFLLIFNSQKINLITSDCILINENNEKIGNSLFNNGNFKSGLFKNFYKNSYVGCCMAFDRKILNASLPFPINTVSHDTWIGLIGEIFGKTFFISEPLIYFRRHDKNFSKHNSGDTFLTGVSPNSIFTIMKNRYILLINLLKRFLKLKIPQCLTIKYS